MSLNTLYGRALNTKPSLGSQVDLSHPLAPGLVDVLLMNENGGTPFSLIQRELATVATGSPAWSSGGRNFGGSAGDQLLDSPRRRLTGACSIAFKVYARIPGTNFRTIISKRDDALSTAEFGFNFDNGGSGAIQWFWANGAFQIVTLVDTMPTNLISSWCLTRPSAATSGKIYKSGLQVASGSGLASPSSTTKPVVYGTSNDFAEGFDGIILSLFLWNRELSAAEATWIHEEPYAFILPPTYRRWFVPAAAGASQTLMGQALL